MAVRALAAVTFVGFGICSASIIPGVADEQAKLQAQIDGTIVLEDGPYDRYVAGGQRGSSPQAVITFGDYVSYQINVDNGGNNVIDDAANEPSIAIDPTAPNRMVAGWRQFDVISSNFRQAGVARSIDGGRTWSDLERIEPGIFRSDPVLGVNDQGRFYYLSLEVTGGEFHCDMFISDDHGVTWPTKSFAFGGDKAWFAIDQTGGPGHGNFYQPWNVAGNPYFPAQFDRSGPDGSTWDLPVPYGDNAFPVFGILDVGPDGAVYVAGARNAVSTSEFWVVRSTNAQNLTFGASFDQIVVVDMGGNTALFADPNPAGLPGQVNISVDKSGGSTHGDIYVLCSVDPPGPDPMNVHLIRSEDSGLTWSDPIVVNDEPGADNGWQWFGTMDVAPNGRIDAVWLSTFGPADNISALYYSQSVDGGDTWSPREQVSPTFDSHVGWPQQNKMGDYYDMTSDNLGADLIWAATFNGEQDVYYTRLGARDCNGNGIDDADDLKSGASMDCNENGIPDQCDIDAGLVLDADENGIPDECQVDCPGDFDMSGSIDVADLLALLAAWGPCADCVEDLDANGAVDAVDLLALLGAWGRCP